MKEEATLSVADAMLSLKTALGVSIATVGTSVASTFNYVSDFGHLISAVGLIISIILAVIQIKRYQMDKEKHELFKIEESQEFKEREIKIEMLEMERNERIEKANNSPRRRCDDPKEGEE